MAYQNQKVKARQVLTQTNIQSKDLGTVSEVPMGEWSSDAQYKKLNTVRAHNATYIAKKDNTAVEPTVSQGWQEVWQIVAHDGRGIESSVVTYQSGISNTDVPAGAWTNDIPDVPQGQYLWTRTVYVFNDGTQSVTYSVSLQGLNFTQEDRNNIDRIEILIPSSASVTNELADKDFVNSSINNMAAFYITYTAAGDAFPSRASLLSATTFYQGGQVRVPTQNDYAIVRGDESQPQSVDGSYPTTRYSYQGGTYPNGQWEFQYVVNNTSLTQAQINAINSGITNNLVNQISANESAIIAEQTIRQSADANLQQQIDEFSKGAVASVNGETGNVTITPESIGAVANSGIYPDLIAGKALSAMYGIATLPSAPNAERWCKLLSFVVASIYGRAYKTMGVTLLYRSIYAAQEGLLIIKVRTDGNGDWTSQSDLRIMPIMGTAISKNNFRVTYDNTNGLATLWFAGSGAYHDIVVTQVSKDFRVNAENPNITYYSTYEYTPTENTTTSLPNDVHEFTEERFFTSAGGTVTGAINVKSNTPWFRGYDAGLDFTASTGANNYRGFEIYDKNNEWVSSFRCFNPTDGSFITQMASRSKRSGTNLETTVELTSGTNGSKCFRPKTNNDMDLGTPTMKWKDVYADTYHGVIFQNVSLLTVATAIGTITGLKNFSRASEIAIVLVRNDNAMFASSINMQMFKTVLSGGWTVQFNNNEWANVAYVSDTAVKLNSKSSSIVSVKFYATFNE